MNERAALIRGPGLAIAWETRLQAEHLFAKIVDAAVLLYGTPPSSLNYIIGRVAPSQLG